MALIVWALQVRAELSAASDAMAALRLSGTTASSGDAHAGGEGPTAGSGGDSDGTAIALAGLALALQLLQLLWQSRRWLLALFGGGPGLGQKLTGPVASGDPP